MIKLKPGVIATRIQPELMLALVIADGVYASRGHKEMVVTSLNDSKHSATSLHYAGQAADLRIWSVIDVEGLASAIRDALGNNPDYEVIVESDHIHIEWQPKYRGAAK